MRELASPVGQLEIGSRHAFHNLGHVGCNAKDKFAQTQHHHLRHRRGEGQHQFEPGAFATLAAGFDAPPQGVHFGQNHVHANAAPGQLSDAGRGCKARRKNEVSDLYVSHGVRIGCDAAGHGFVADALQVQARPIVIEFDRHFIALMLQVDRDGA